MKKTVGVLLCFLQIFNSGCASIVQGNRQTVMVDTQPAGASVTISGLHEQFITPTEMVLKRKNEYELEISKAGYKTEYVQIDHNLSGWFWANLLFGGIIGIIVDFITGAGHKLEPKEVHLTLQPQAA